MLQLRREQQIDAGSWANIYLISPRRIVKVFRDAYKDQEDKLIKDELRGAAKYKHALPILRVIDVITPKDRRARGMVKKYLPYKVSIEEMHALYNNRWQCMPSDALNFNFRRDYDGTIYYVDTQVRPC